MGLETPARGPRVFISYAFSNIDVASLEADLRLRGFRPSVVRATTLLGEPSLSRAIRQRIRDSDYVLPVVDAAAKDSAWVQEEIRIAQEEGVRTIPLLEPGVQPDGVLRDIPCVVEGGVESAANRILEDHSLLDFDLAYPAHIVYPALIDFMRFGRRPWIDANGALSRGLATVVESLLAVGHLQLSEQTRSQWRDMQHALDSLQFILPEYRQCLQVFLDGYGDPERKAVESFGALTRLTVGRHLIRFMKVCPPSQRPWKDLNPGASRINAEWGVIAEEDEQSHLWLWGLGGREVPFDQWSHDPQSPLGDWLYTTATVHDGKTFPLVLPDEPVIASGIRLREPPERYLRSWHWLDCILPQMVDYRMTLSPDLGQKMLVALRQG